MNLQKRSPAKILDLATIANADLITQDNVNYIMVNQNKIDRVNIISIIVDINENQLTNNILLKVDDGTAIMPVMVFDPQSFDKNINIGDFVLIIGKVREFNKSRYIAAEIVKKTTKKWFSYRKKQIEKITNKQTNTSKVNTKIDEQEVEEQKVTTNDKVKVKDANENEEILVDEVVLKDEESKNDENINDTDPTNNDKKQVNKDKLVYDLIEKFDDGEGADLDRIILESKLDDCEEIIRKLLREGEIYEVRPNKFKVL